MTKATRIVAALDVPSTIGTGYASRGCPSLLGYDPAQELPPYAVRAHGWRAARKVPSL